MPSKRKAKPKAKAHDHRGLVEADSPEVECECGERFEDDAAWVRHQEKRGTPLEEIHEAARAEGYGE